jgi:hypothetical protein
MTVVNCPTVRIAAAASHQTRLAPAGPNQRAAAMRQLIRWTGRPFVMLSYKQQARSLTLQ